MLLSWGENSTGQRQASECLPDRLLIPLIDRQLLDPQMPGGTEGECLAVQPMSLGVILTAQKRHGQSAQIGNTVAFARFTVVHLRRQLQQRWNRGPGCRPQLLELRRTSAATTEPAT